MESAELEKMCERAASGLLDRKKVASTALVLLICGFLAVACFGLAEAVSPWLSVSLGFLPIFLSMAILMGWGVVLARSYRDALKQYPTSISEVLHDSWKIVLGAAALFVPVITAYLFLWFGLCFFFLFASIPVVGPFFSTIFAFGPFLLNLGACLLVPIGLYMLFGLTPAVAFRALSPSAAYQYARRKWRERPLAKLLLAVIAYAPLCITKIILLLATWMTVHVSSPNPLQLVAQCFFIMIPASVLLAPSVLFFFQMACEAYAYVHRQEAKKERTQQEARVLTLTREN